MRQRTWGLVGLAVLTLLGLALFVCHASHEDCLERMREAGW